MLYAKIELWKRHPEGASQLILNEREELRETHTLKRGDFLQPDKVITPGVPAFLHPLPARTEKGGGNPPDNQATENAGQITFHNFFTIHQVSWLLCNPFPVGSGLEKRVEEVAE